MAVFAADGTRGSLGCAQRIVLSLRDVGGRRKDGGYFAADGIRGRRSRIAGPCGGMPESGTAQKVHGKAVEQTAAYGNPAHKDGHKMDL